MGFRTKERIVDHSVVLYGIHRLRSDGAASSPLSFRLYSNGRTYFYETNWSAFSPLIIATNLSFGAVASDRILIAGKRATAFAPVVVVKAIVTTEAKSFGPEQ